MTRIKVKFIILSICVLSLCASLIPACSLTAEKVNFEIKPMDKKQTESNAHEVQTIGNVIMKMFKTNKRLISKLAIPVAEVLKKISRPVRDAWVKELQSAQNLIPFLQHLALPADPTPRSKWYESLTPDDVLSRVRSMLVDLSAKSELMKEISDDDLRTESKVGPQGGHPGINSLLPKMLEYFGYYVEEADKAPALEAQRATFSSQRWLDAKRNVIRELQFNRRLRPMSFRKVVEILKDDNKLITNCGFVPGVSFRRRNRPEVISKVLELQKGSNWKQPAIIGERTTRGKTRFIFMTSMATNVHGSAYSMVLQDAIRKLNLNAFSAWEGQEHVDRAMTSMMSGIIGEVHQRAQCFISTDFTGMDQRFNRACMLQVYDVIKEAFQQQYWEDLREVINYIAETPVIFPLEDGTVLESVAEHSLISGSEWTNLLETLFAYVMWHYAKLEKDDFLVLGDDGIARSPWDLDSSARQFSQLSHDIGMTANEAKQLVSSEKAHYLQRYYYKQWSVPSELAPGQMELGGVYPIMLATNSLMNPERFHDPRKWDHRMLTLRNLMITENTCDHPCFEEFARFVGKGDKYLKEFVTSSNEDLDKLEKQARSIPGFVPSYNQEHAEKRIYQFKVFKAWKSMVEA